MAGGIASTTAAFNETATSTSMHGKVVFITGGTSGIGRATVTALAAHSPAYIYFTGRNAEAAAAVIAEARQIGQGTEVIYIPCDLSWTRERIRDAVLQNFHATRLDVLIANAGIMAVPAGLTDEGFEVQFGTNVLGHAVLLQLLRPVMLRTASLSDDAGVRFVSLSSSGHTMHPSGGIQFDHLREPGVGSTWQRYGQSKLGNILLAKGMAAHHPQILSVAVHPGLVGTNLTRATAPGLLKSIFALVRRSGLPVYKTPKQGVENTLWAVSAPRADVENGAYYVPVGERTRFGQAKAVEDAGLAERLWEWIGSELRDLQPM